MIMKIIKQIIMKKLKKSIKSMVIKLMNMWKKHIMTEVIEVIK